MHADEVALGPGGDARRPTDQVVVAGRAGDGHRDALARLPGRGDAVALAVVLERLVDAVGHPEQRELPQGREVAGAEVVAQRGVDLVGPVDVAVGHPAAQRLRRRVDQLDLLGRTDHRVRDRLLLADARDPLHDIVERLEVLDVDRGDHVDAGVQQLLDVLPPLLVAEPGTLVWASSSMRATSGVRARTASRSISSKALPRWGIVWRGITSRSRACSAVRGGCGTRQIRRPRQCHADAVASPR